MSTGSGFTPVVLVSAKSFKLTRGTLRYFSTDSIRKSRNKRGYCGECGSRITGGEAEESPRWLGVTAASLDDPSLFKAEFEIFTSHAQKWDLLDPSLPHHPEYQPQK